MRIKHASFREPVNLAGTNNSIGTDMAKFRALNLEMELRNGLLDVRCDKGRAIVPAANIVYALPADE